MRWLLLLVSVSAFAFAFNATSAGALGLSLLVAFGSLVAGFLGFVAARIETQSETHSARAATLVARSRGKAGARAAVPAATTAAASGDEGTSWMHSGEGRDDHRGHRHLEHAGDDGGHPGGDAGGGSDGGGSD